MPPAFGVLDRHRHRGVGGAGRTSSVAPVFAGRDTRRARVTERSTLASGPDPRCISGRPRGGERRTRVLRSTAMQRTPPKLTFAERLYLPQVIGGIAVTTRHFARNLLLHVLHVFGFARDRRAAVHVVAPEDGEVGVVVDRGAQD